MTTPTGEGTGTGQPATATDAGDQAGQGQQQGSTQQGQQGQSNGQTGDGQTGDGAATGGGRTPEQEIAYWKNRSRTNEQTARSNAAAAQELAALKDRDKTELQRAQDQAAAAQAAAAEATAARHRLLAATKQGLGTELVEFLGSGSEDEINARAETLKAQIQNTVNAQVTAELARYGLTPANGQAGSAPTAGAAASLAQGRRPVETLRPGSVPASDQQTSNDPNNLFRGMLGRQ